MAVMLFECSKTVRARNPLRLHHAEERVHVQLALPVPIAQLRHAYVAALTTQVPAHVGRAFELFRDAGGSRASKRARLRATRISL